MLYLQNHCFCLDSNWGGEYHCRHLVSFKSYSEDKEDWVKMVEDTSLKPEVLVWLKENVPDRKDDECTKGWCIGSDEYRRMDLISMTVFFHRRKDTMAFIRKWSQYKKPVRYVQYFTDVRKTLDLETGKYILD